MDKNNEQVKDDNPFAGRKYVRALGRRKTATAVVKVYNRGKGQFYVNRKLLDDYLKNANLSEIAKQSLQAVGLGAGLDIDAKVAGGGLKSQAEAMRLAIARAALLIDESLKPTLRKAGFVTVDSRVKERKKPGLKRARRSPQWSKR